MKDHFLKGETRKIIIFGMHRVKFIQEQPNLLILNIWEQDALTLSQRQLFINQLPNCFTDTKLPPTTGLEIPVHNEILFELPT